MWRNEEHYEFIKKKLQSSETCAKNHGCCLFIYFIWGIPDKQIVLSLRGKISLMFTYVHLIICKCESVQVWIITNCTLNEIIV